MALTVKQNLSSVLGTLAQPGNEAAVTLEWPMAMPIRHDQQRGHDAELRAEVPRGTHIARLRRRDIVDGHDQHGRRASSWYMSKITSKVAVQEWWRCA